MSVENLSPILFDYKALVVGIANEDSIAYGCAKAFQAVGADVAVVSLWVSLMRIQLLMVAPKRSKP
jgi:enoyl-[acyl-carrier protein] reductase I